MTASLAKPKTYTPEEYLLLEENSGIRHEYRNGEIVPTAGNTPNHNQITLFLIELLLTQLKGKPYEVFGMDLRLWIPQQSLYIYPDVMVVPRPVQLKEGRKDTVINPLFIAEVLSGSTQGYDRGDKFTAYRTISTFQEYLLIDQYHSHVEHYFKQDARQWIFKDYDSLQEEIILSSLGITLSLNDLYETIGFDDSESQELPLSQAEFEDAYQEQ